MTYLKRRFRKKSNQKQFNLVRVQIGTKRPSQYSSRYPLVKQFDGRINRLRFRRRDRSEKVTPWLAAKFISVRRNFYVQLYLKERLVFQRSSGQVNLRYRQRPSSVSKLVKLLFHRLRRFVKKYPRVYIPRFRPNYRTFYGRYKRYHPTLFRSSFSTGKANQLPPAKALERLRRWKLVSFIFDRYQPVQLWLDVQYKLRDWLYRNRKHVIKVQVKFKTRKSHNGMRLKKLRRK